MHDPRHAADRHADEPANPSQHPSAPPVDSGVADASTEAYTPGSNSTYDETLNGAISGGEAGVGQAGGTRTAFLQPSDKPGSIGRLGHYEVSRILGQGAFGIVLHAFDEKLHRQVAIKVMAAHVANDPAFRERFLREARAAASIRNPHVVQMFEVSDDPLPYLAMEYVSGPTLSDVINEQGLLDVPVIVRIGLQIARGLAAAHAQKKIHRDIKPANILLAVAPGNTTAAAAEGTVKITDFGLARAFDDARFTQTGFITGTPLYMSPEQARGEPLDARSDLFSLGSVLYVLCTRQPPFNADRTLGVLKRVCEDAPQAIQEINPNIPEWLSTVINRLHTKDRAARFQSADEVAELLQRCLAHLNDPSVALP